MRSSFPFRPVVVSAIAALALISGPLAFAPAQAAEVSVTGTVVDSSGRPVVGATVAVWVKDEDEGAYVPDEIEAETDERGRYELDLEPGTYRFGIFGGDRYETEYYKDATRLKLATSVVVETSAIRLDTVELQLLPTIEGSVRTTSNTPVPYAYVMALTGNEQDGYRSWGFADVEPDGTYSLPVPEGTYVVGFFDEDDDYEGEFWDDSATIEDATPVAVDADGVSGINAVLTAIPTPVRGTVQNVVPPAVDGFATVGGTLSARDGLWTQSAVTTRQWLRNGTPIPGATGPTYQVTAADLGASLSIRVTGAAPSFLPGYATSPPSFVVRWSSRIVATSKTGRKKAVVTIKVVSNGPRPNGVITLRLGRTVVKTVKVRNGRARVTITKQPRTLMRYDVQFVGDATVYAARAGVRVTLKKVKKK